MVYNHYEYLTLSVHRHQILTSLEVKIEKNQLICFLYAPKNSSDLQTLKKSAYLFPVRLEELIATLLTSELRTEWRKKVALWAFLVFVGYFIYIYFALLWFLLVIFFVKLAIMQINGSPQCSQ